MSDHHVCTPACTQMLEAMERDETLKRAATILAQDNIAYVDTVELAAAKRLAVVAADTPVAREAIERLIAGRDVGPVLSREICEACGAPPGSLEQIVEGHPLILVWAARIADDPEWAERFERGVDTLQAQVVAATVLRQHRAEVARARSELKELTNVPF